MLDVNRLPLPDWGLKCLHCGAALAGVAEHCCAACGEPFSVFVLLARQRPIADVGLVCPQCGYLLTGLMEERCPECGTAFCVRDLLDEQSLLDFDDGAPVRTFEDGRLRRREPRLTGKERPLPDWGLRCAACGRPVAGASANECPHCGALFDLDALTGRGDWVEVGGYFSEGIGLTLAMGLLYQDQVPFMAIGFLRTRARLLVAREFLFDALECLTAAKAGPALSAGEEWQCPECEEQVPDNFGTCWNCGASRPA
jgi:hypothetical protein